MVQTNLSAGRREPVDQLGLVDPQHQTEQSVLPGSDADEVGTVPTGPDVAVDEMLGLYITRRPVGPDRTFSTCDPDRPVADGPVGPERTFSTCDPDRPVADGPVSQLFILGPLGPRRMFSQYEMNQSVAVGPVGQPFTTDPVGTHEMVSNCKRMIG